MSINLNLDGLRERAKCIKEEEVVQETGHEVKVKRRQTKYFKIRFYLIIK